MSRGKLSNVQPAVCSVRVASAHFFNDKSMLFFYKLIQYVNFVLITEGVSNLISLYACIQNKYIN